MNLAEAEAVVALGTEIDSALKLLDDEEALHNDWAHPVRNYLDVDIEILWNTISEDLPVAHERMTADIAAARTLLDEETNAQDSAIES